MKLKSSSYQYILGLSVCNQHKSHLKLSCQYQVFSDHHLLVLQSQKPLEKLGCVFTLQLCFLIFLVMGYKLYVMRPDEPCSLIETNPRVKAEVWTKDRSKGSRKCTDYWEVFLDSGNYGQKHMCIKRSKRNFNSHLKEKNKNNKVRLYTCRDTLSLSTVLLLKKSPCTPCQKCKNLVQEMGALRGTVAVQE